MRLVELGPEKAHKGVPANEPPGSGEGEIREESDTLLAEKGIRTLLSVFVAEIECAEDSE
jgi:hypothetical protein